MLSFLKKHSPDRYRAFLRAKLQDSPLAHRLARGVAWSFVGAVLTRFFTLASTAIVVRILGKESYGEFGMVQSTLLLLGTFAGMGLGITATKHTAEYRVTDPVRVGRLLGLLIFAALSAGFVMLLIGWFGSNWLATRILNKASLEPFLRATSILVLVGAVDGVFTAALEGFEAFRRVAKLSIYIALFSPIVTVPLVYFFGLKGAVAALVISNAAQMLVDGVAFWRECAVHHVTIGLDRMSWREWPVLVHFALPALAANLLVMPATWIANVILVNYGGGYVSLGTVNVVTTFRTLAMYLPTILLAPILAILSNEVHNPAAVRSTLRYALGMSSLSVLPLAVGLTCVGRFALGLIYGEEYAADGPLLACAMTVAAIQATGAGIGSYLNAMGRMWLGLSINLLFAVSFIGFAYLLIPTYGAIGYMVALSAAYLALVIIVYGAFAVIAPDITKCYPLGRVLTLFGFLMAMAIYTNLHANLFIAATAALFLGLGMAGASAVPLFQTVRKKLFPRSVTDVPLSVTGGQG